MGAKRQVISALCCVLPLLTLPPKGLAQSPNFVINGAGPELERNIRAHVSLPELGCDQGGYRLARNLPGIRENIVRAGRALGYYRLEHVTRFEQTESCWELRTDVEPGPAVTITAVDVEVSGQQQFFQPTLNDLPVSTGQQLNQSDYERIKTNLRSLAVENGFFDARFPRSELRLDLVDNVAEIDISFEPGERYRLGAIRMGELDALAPEFIERFLNLEPGDAYSSQALLQLRQSLNGSQYFNSVAVTPAITEAVERRIPVDVELQMRRRHRYAIGLGATTDTGPRVRMDYTDRYLNRRGHSLNGLIGFSPVQQNLDMQYRIPLTDPATESLNLSSGFLREETDSFESETTKLAATYSFINAWNWRQNYFVNLQHDKSVIGSESQNSDLLIGGISLDRTRTDNALNPTRGWRLFGEIKGASEALLSSDSFLQLNLSGKAIRSIGPGRFLLRFDVGTSLMDDIAELPATVRYFTGGDQSVRGYKYDTLGPVNEDGVVLGGKHRLTGSIEYDFTVMPNWKLAVFTDAGNAFNDFNDFELRKSVGLGVRWMSPVGPIRVDLASALDNDNELRLHITMGPDL